jgi:hypothetical protein
MRMDEESPTSMLNEIRNRLARGEGVLPADVVDRIRTAYQAIPPERRWYDETTDVATEVYGTVVDPIRLENSVPLELVDAVTDSLASTDLVLPANIGALIRTAYTLLPEYVREAYQDHVNGGQPVSGGTGTAHSVEVLLYLKVVKLIQEESAASIEESAASIAALSGHEAQSARLDAGGGGSLDGSGPAAGSSADPGVHLEPSRSAHPEGPSVGEVFETLLYNGMRDRLGVDL